MFQIHKPIKDLQLTLGMISLLYDKKFMTSLPLNI